ncbi:MAG: Dabb family protein [Calditrichaeota bacterium]|nr:Dabb family protein [Calditrichota bacterium]MCB9369012.1 Dabb family protein [Calditrichota bacterium]
MIKHVVMLRLHEEAGGHKKQENAIRLKSALENLSGKIDSLHSIEVGINEAPDKQAFDLVLTCDITDWPGLESYRVHPLHQEVLTMVRQVCSDRAVVDYETHC